MVRRVHHISDESTKCAEDKHGREATTLTTWSLTSKTETAPLPRLLYATLFCLFPTLVQFVSSEARVKSIQKVV